MKRKLMCKLCKVKPRTISLRCGPKLCDECFGIALGVLEKNISFTRYIRKPA